MKYSEHRIEPIANGYLVRSYCEEYGPADMRAFSTWEYAVEFIKDNVATLERKE